MGMGGESIGGKESGNGNQANRKQDINVKVSAKYVDLPVMWFEITGRSRSCWAGSEPGSEIQSTSSVTVRVTETLTSPSSGSLLRISMVAVYMPGFNPEESKVTVKL
jgi:hypothetical protein